MKYTAGKSLALKRKRTSLFYLGFYVTIVIILINAAAWLIFSAVVIAGMI